jgi:hypothetical protein
VDDGVFVGVKVGVDEGTNPEVGVTVLVGVGEAAGLFLNKLVKHCLN